VRAVMGLAFDRWRRVKSGSRLSRATRRRS